MSTPVCRQHFHSTPILADDKAFVKHYFFVICKKSVTPLAKRGQAG